MKLTRMETMNWDSSSQYNVRETLDSSIYADT